jgi:hypothetical protein
MAKRQPRSPFVAARPLQGLPNNQNSAQPATASTATPINIARLSFWLSGYQAPSKEYLLSGFSNGFRIRFQGPSLSVSYRNHSSATRNPQIVRDMLAAELTAQRIAGPFPQPPFDPFVISPLGLVPKKEHGRFRLIHDLSYSPQGAVNDFIDPQDAAVQYETLDRVIELIQHCGAGALIAKLDIESAFRIVHLLGFSFFRRIILLR